MNRVIVYSILGLIAVGALYTTWSRHHTAKLCHEVAARLGQVIHADPRFADVRIDITMDRYVTVFAPDALPSATKADLERIVAEQGKPLHVHVAYLTPSPISRAESSNKAIQLTATRRMFTFSMTRLLPPHLALGVGSRS